MMPYAILIHGTLNETWQVPEYVRHYDADYHVAGGVRSGNLITSPDPNEAKRYATSGEAFEELRRQSRTVPLRPDGKPNRPMTAFTVEIVEIHPNA